MTYAKHVRAALLLALAFGSSACSESSPADLESGQEPWNEQFMIGNSSFNTAEVTTNQDGVSPDILSDYVTQAALPQTALEVFTTHVYVPTTRSHVTRLSDVSISVGYTNGSRTPNIVYDAEYVQQSTVGGKLYDVFRLDGWFQGTPAIYPANFANVVFQFRLDYLNDNGNVLATRNRMAEIYKR